MPECPFTHIYKVLRVSWLKAKARYDRWSEEIHLVQHEMCWTTLWFKHQEKEWEQRVTMNAHPGHQAYAAKQQTLWGNFRKKAEEAFEEKMVMHHG